MILLNFSHPITPEERAKIEALTGQHIEETRYILHEFNIAKPFTPQAIELANACNLSSEEWQTRPILIVPPSLNFITVTLLAELHGRMGYFPSIVRTRPIENSTPQIFEVAEIINLQAVRDDARKRRS